MNSFYSRSEVEFLGLAQIGKNVLISRKASIYSPEKMTIGDNVRIDDFCILSGTIHFSNNIHIAAGCYLFAGSSEISFADYSGLSSRCTVYASSDDYSGDYLTNPMVPDEYRHVISASVSLGKHVVVGSGSTVLPGVSIAEGCSIGSMSLITKSTEPWGIYVGIPCKRIKDRSKRVLELEELHRASIYTKFLEDKNR